MTYSRSKKTTDFEKRLQTLRNQLYGKDSLSSSLKSSTNTFRFQTNSALVVTDSAAPASEANYLKRDLKRISLLAAGALFIQLLLYLGVQSGILFLG